MAIRFCEACRGVKECPTCHEAVTGFNHVGVRGVAPAPSRIWHYAVPCGHRYSAAQPVQASKGALAVYNGGPLWGAGYRWQNVYWGSYWSKAGIPFTTSQVDRATADLEADPSYSGGLSEYNVGQGSVLASVVIGSDPPQTVDDSQVGGFIDQWIQAGLVPDLGQKGAYNIFFPPGVTVTLSGDKSCVQFCDFHDTDGTHFYTVEPFSCQSGCNQSTGSEFDTLTQGLSEEMVELKTDMNPGTGWVIGQEELCDYCDASFKCNQVSTGEYVNASYSNRHGACWVPTASSSPSRPRRVARSSRARRTGRRPAGSGGKRPGRPSPSRSRGSTRSRRR